MSRILIFGGTTEGRLLAQALARRGVPAAVSVATVLGAEELSGLPGITPWWGGRRRRRWRPAGCCDRCVDATHPYAREVSENIRSPAAPPGSPCAPCCAGRASCRRAVFWWAVRRRPHSSSSPGRETFSWPSEPRGCPPFRPGPGAALPRVLPVEESLLACRRAGGPHQKHHRHARALLPKAQRGHSGAVPLRWMVTKDGGSAGGFGRRSPRPRIQESPWWSLGGGGLWRGFGCCFGVGAELIESAQGEFRPAGRVTFSTMRKSPKNRRGTLRMDTPCPYSPYPRAPITGGHPLDWSE